MLPALMINIRAAAIANENAARPGPGQTGGSGGSGEQDVAAEPPPGPPLVRALRRRPGATYARAGNVILPLAFAERMPGWRTHAAPRRRA
jgi:hypothetical protein